MAVEDGITTCDCLGWKHRGGCRHARAFDRLRHPAVVVDTFLAQFRPHCGKPTEYLLSRAALDSLPTLYAQEHVADPTVFVTFFDPCSGWTWFATEARVERDDAGAIEDVLYFGHV